MREAIHGRGSRSGSVMVMAAFALTALMGIAALVIDIGLLYVASQTAQGTADECAVSALAGKSVFKHPPAAYGFDMTAVRNEVTNLNGLVDARVPKMNSGIDGRYVTSTVADTGTITPPSGTPIPQFSSANFHLAVEVDCGIPVDMTFARIFGLNQKTVHAKAIALLYFDPEMTYAFAPWAITSSTMIGSGVPAVGMDVGKTTTLNLNNALDASANMKTGFTAIAFTGDKTDVVSYGSRLQNSVSQVPLKSDLGAYGVGVCDIVRLADTAPSLNATTASALSTRFAGDTWTYATWSAAASGGSYPDTNRILIVPVADKSNRRVNGFAPLFIDSFNASTGKVTCTLVSATLTGGKLRWGTKDKASANMLSLVSKIALYDRDTALTVP
jgi:hypothetical protein